MFYIFEAMLSMLVCTVHCRVSHSVWAWTVPLVFWRFACYFGVTFERKDCVLHIQWFITQNSLHRNIAQNLTLSYMVDEYLVRIVSIYCMAKIILQTQSEVVKVSEQRNWSCKWAYQIIWDERWGSPTRSNKLASHRADAPHYPLRTMTLRYAIV